MKSYSYNCNSYIHKLLPSYKIKPALNYIIWNEYGILMILTLAWFIRAANHRYRASVMGLETYDMCSLSLSRVTCPNVTQTDCIFSYIIMHAKE